MQNLQVHHLMYSLNVDIFSLFFKIYNYVIDFSSILVLGLINVSRTRALAFRYTTNSEQDIQHQAFNTDVIC